MFRRVRVLFVVTGLLSAVALVNPISASAVPRHRARQVVSGWLHTCALLTNGTVECWGDNSNGQLGDGGAASSTTPVAVAGLTNAKAIDAGLMHTCALLMNQTVECWGSNFGGAIGDGTTTDALVPTAVTGLTGVKSIATGEYSTCALLLTKTVTCWGINVHGELGNGTFTASLAPTAVPGLSRVRALSSHGDQGACALLPGGTARCWGDNFLGQLGDGTSGFYSANPVAVSNLVKARAISIGMSHACAVLTTSTVECWGDNSQGELGTGDNSSSNVPVVVPDLTGVKAISVGGGNPSAGAHTCALLATRTLECWGSNNVGQLGTGDNISSTVPVPVGLANVKAVAGNGLGQTTCALVVRGDAYCWGSNFKGQVGNGTTTDTSTPSLVPL